MNKVFIKNKNKNHSEFISESTTSQVVTVTQTAGKRGLLYYNLTGQALSKNTSGWTLCNNDKKVSHSLNYSW